MIAAGEVGILTRRRFVGLALLSGAGAVAPARAQTERVRRIGILVPSAYGAGMIPEFSRRLAALEVIQ